MKVYTVEDLATFEKDEYGRFICPTGDYTQIKSFGKSCSFGDKVLKIDRIGSRKGCTYFFKTLSEIYVRCGCFFGTIKGFRKKVMETHKDNEKYRIEYLEAIKYAKKVLGYGGQNG